MSKQRINKTLKNTITENRHSREASPANRIRTQGVPTNLLNATLSSQLVNLTPSSGQNTHLNTALTNNQSINVHNPILDSDATDSETNGSGSARFANKRKRKNTLPNIKQHFTALANGYFKCNYISPENHKCDYVKYRPF